MFGLTQMKTFALAALFAAASLITSLGAAQAATVSSSCPDSGTWDRTWDRTFSLSSSDGDVGAIDCYAWGAGPAIHESDMNDQLTADG